MAQKASISCHFEPQSVVFRRRDLWSGVRPLPWLWDFGASRAERPNEGFENVTNEPTRHLPAS